MWINIFLASLLACIQFSTSFLTLKDFDARPDLKECYNIRYGSTTGSTGRLDYQPLAHSLETFISLVERLESASNTPRTVEIIQKLLTSYRVDGLPGNFKSWGSIARSNNIFEKALFNINDKLSEIYFKDELTEDERCSLHFMLSHSVNFTVNPSANEDVDENGNAKRPKESGVVSLQAKWKQAFALDRVLLGIMAALSGNNEIDSSTFCRRVGCDISGVKVNRLYAVTVGDLISVYVLKYLSKNNEKKMIGNGVWNDLSCTTQYILEETKDDFYITNSMVRGAMDGLIIGKKISNNLEFYKNIPLSQILRMYYGPTGLLDETEAKSGTRSDTHWCSRDRHFSNTPNVKEEVLNFHKVYADALESTPTDDTPNEIDLVLTLIRTSPDISEEVKDEYETCSSTVESIVDKCTTPFDIFAVLDWQTTDQQRNFQIEVIGNLSNNFDVRPRGSSVGVYRNARYQTNGLEVIANNSGSLACSACFIRYNNRAPSRIGEIEVFERLNQTLSSFVEAYDNAQNMNGDIKAGAPAKVILYFNYGNPSNDYKLGEAIWDVKKSFQESTVLAIGSRKESLTVFTQNDDLDIFTESTNAASFVTKLRTRLCKVPAEFQYKDCQRRSQFSSTSDNQEAFIGVNKKQYWAMYPKYFLKSFGITLKFKAQDGAKIRVCFTRQYYRIAEENAQNLDCQESAGEDIKFYVNNPCHRRSVHSCDPFYFLVEGKQTAPTMCTSPRCSSPRDIQFEFEHEGISCNAASFISVSTLTLLFAGLLFILQRH